MGASLCLLHNANSVPMAENALPSLAGPGGEASYTSGFLPALAPQAEAGVGRGLEPLTLAFSLPHILII